MNVLLVCSKCGKELKVVKSILTTLGNLVIDVEPCLDKSHTPKPDCSRCDDLEELEELRGKIVKVKVALEYSSEDEYNER